MVLSCYPVVILLSLSNSLRLCIVYRITGERERVARRILWHIQLLLQLVPRLSLIGCLIIGHAT